jgi:hypothetical protein
MTRTDLPLEIGERVGKVGPLIFNRGECFGMVEVDIDIDTIVDDVANV